MKITLKRIGLGALAVAAMSGCSSGGSISSGGGSTSGTQSSNVALPGTLVGVNNGSQSQNVSAQALPLGSGVAYYLPIVNTSTDSTLSVASATVTNTGVWAVDASDCTNVATGKSCTLGVAFNGSNITDPAQLNTVVELTYSNGVTSSFPLSGNIVEPGQLNVQMPATIVPDANGDAIGTIIVFNGESQSQQISASDITPTSQQGVTWAFTTNCDGVGGSTVASLAACSVSYKYHIDKTQAASTTDTTPVSISIPVVNAVTGVTSVQQPSASITPPLSTASPAPILVYSGGAVSLATGSGSFSLQNVGNAAVGSIQVAGEGLTQTNTCQGAVAGTLCTVSLTGTPTTNNVTVTYTSGSTVKTINVPVVGQALAVSPARYSFGQNFGGAVVTKQVTITNLGATALTLVRGSLSGDSAFSINAANTTCPLSGTTASVNAFTSCVVMTQYTAPNATANQTATLTVSANSQSNQTVALDGSSLQSDWTNYFTTVTGYTDSVFTPNPAILAMTSNSDGNFIFGNSNAPGESGARNVWAQAVNQNVVAKASNSWTGYVQSAPTALLDLGNAAAGTERVYVGHYDGSVQSCSGGVTSGACTDLLAASVNSTFGVTSVTAINTNSYAGLSDKTTGTTGRLYFSTSGGSYTQVAGVTGAVGKMATNGTLTYVPVHTANSKGVLSTYDNSGALVAADVAPAGLTNTATDKEFVTVVFYDANDSKVYVGTSMGNVYSSTQPVSSTSWTKLNTNRLSTSSIVTAIGATATNVLYVGLGNLTTPTNGGALFVLVNSAFTSAPGYSDTSSVSAMYTFSGKLNVATYGNTNNGGGKIWQIQ